MLKGYMQFCQFTRFINKVLCISRCVVYGSNSYFFAHRSRPEVVVYCNQAMSTFTQHLNPITGQNEWNPQREDYDYKQEVARSAYADMLHDSERNEKYRSGIKKCISILREQGKEVHVLDIGTGTGLLSMIALSIGVDSVTACEAFSPMTECAKKIFKINGFEDKVRLVGKRSTELEVGPDKDLIRKANLLVTEVFDTELIGEGAIETFTHAKEFLLTEDALIVPSEGTVYAQVVSSELLRRWNKMIPISLNDDKGDFRKNLLKIPSEILNCSGSAAVHDLQLSEISKQWFTPMSEPIPVFQFDWSGRKIPIVKNRTVESSFKPLTIGECDAVFMWWDLKMDPSGEEILSCAPLWDHPVTKGCNEVNSNMIPWRDHWMQAVYYFPRTVKVNCQDNLSLVSNHDEYSLWFDVKNTPSDSVPERPICDCGLHIISSRTRLGQLSDPRRRNFYIKILKKYLDEDSICLMLGNFPYLGIVAAKLGARHVYLHETNSIAVRLLEKFIRVNGVQDKVTILSTDLKNVTLEKLEFHKATIIFGEPNFSTSILPWHSLQFLYLLQSGQHLIASDAVILPSKVTIKGLPVQFRDLWKIRCPLNSCFDFSMQIFDQLIESASDEVDENVEPQPLWEYPTKALGPPETLLTIPIDQSSENDQISLSCSLEIEANETSLNGMAIWADWHFDDSNVLTTGPTEPIHIGHEITWDMYTRQGVHFFKNHSQKTMDNTVKVRSNSKYNKASGTVSLNFQVDM